ncbi:histamine H2 receptor-like [Antedon mediterranea]|uniref:histamine H2 receptor-like n=1 Tax=Antedon mediterranea TaxID=105859 RepID=UPI003AF7F91A
MESSSSSSSDYDIGNQTDDTLIVSGGIVIRWLLSIVTVLGNGLVIFALTTEISLRSNPANLFILNLSVADFLVGAFSLPFNTFWLMFDYWPFGEGVCKMWLIIDYTACTVSVCGIILISLDRYFMLNMKLKYRQFQTTKRVTVMILVSWAVIIPFSSKYKRKNVNATISSMRRHRKAAVTLAVLVSVFIVCWTPYCIVLIWSFGDDSPDYILLEVVYYLIWSNSAINPFLYALTNLKIKVFLKFLRFKCFK